MSMKKRSTALAIAALTAGGLVTMALPASAIDRVTCTSDMFAIYSPNTTCWANAGSIGVNLYQTTAGFSGNNTGKVSAVGFYRVFTSSYQSQSWNSHVVTQVSIY